MPHCVQCNAGFEIDPEDGAMYRRFLAPDPDRCRMCRLRHLLAFWPFGILQKRTCDLTGETIISTFSSGSRFPVYKREHWFSDRWDPPMMEIDWSRSFFDQLYELTSQTPHFHQLGNKNVNCDYTDDVWECKNGYMCRSIVGCEDTYYSYRLIRCRDCFDITYCIDCTRCYESTYCVNSYGLKYSLDCQNASDSWFLYDCRGCRDCFMSWNLRNKEYHIFNKPYSREEYFEKIGSLKLNSRAFLKQLQAKFISHLLSDAVHKPDYNIRTEQCVGNYVLKSKNCFQSYFLEECEDCRYTMRTVYSKDCIDVVGPYRGELHCQTCQTSESYNVMGALYSVNCKDSFYIDQCFDSTFLFGCVGLKRRNYCILNKSYSETEYKDLTARLRRKMMEDGEWGRFFPLKFAYNGFNLSLGSFYFNETPETIKRQGGWWEAEGLSGVSDGALVRPLPDTSEGVTDDWAGQAVRCSETGRLYGFCPQELSFYREEKLPLPDRYPEYRNKRRFARMAPLTPQNGVCFFCRKAITHYYPPEWGYAKIACTDCYQKTVY